MVSDSSDMPVKNIKDRFVRWKDFFEDKQPLCAICFSQVTDSFVEPYVCDCEPPVEGE